MYVAAPFAFQLIATIIGAFTSTPIDSLKLSFSPPALTLASLIAGIVVISSSHKLGFIFEIGAQRIYWLLAILVPFSIHFLHKTLHYFLVSPHERTVGLQSPNDISKLLLSIVLAPIFEEFILRGLLFSWFSRKYSVVLSATLTTIVFVFLHVNLWLTSLVETLVLLVGSIFLMSLRIWSKSLGPSMLMHSIYNFSEIFL